MPFQHLIGTNTMHPHKLSAMPRRKLCGTVLYETVQNLCGSVWNHQRNCEVGGRVAGRAGVYGNALCLSSTPLPTTRVSQHGQISEEASAAAAAAIAKAEASATIARQGAPTSEHSHAHEALSIPSTGIPLACARRNTPRARQLLISGPLDSI